MYTIKNIILLFISIGFYTVFGEGTKEIAPTGTNDTRMLLKRYYDYSEFARYGAQKTERLNFTICGTNEKVYFGFRANDNSTTKLRVKRWLDDAIVFNEVNMPTSGEGFINTRAEAEAGPEEIVGNGTGYNAFQIDTLSPGDYYIEFNTNDTDYEFRYFDITVASSTNQAITGRVWSQEWLLTTRNFNNSFDEKLYIYSDDGIVTSLDFNGIKPYTFNISANPTGVKTTGNFNEDRQSVSGRQTYPQYKIFLNPPDENCYPSGEFGTITDDITITGCGLDKCINVPVDQNGRVLILLDLNGQAGYQPNSADIQLDTVVKPGINCIPWDTRDNLGNLIPEGQNVNIQIDYLNGITHLPMFDVESHPSGYSVDLVRPLAPQVPIKPFLFWDDLNIVSQGGVQGTAEFLGCQDFACHKWIATDGFNNNQTDYGNLTTINTWWYANIINKTTNYIVSNATVDADTRIPGRGADGGNDTTICRNSGPFQLAGNVSEAPSATWSTSGSGSFSNLNDLFGTYTPSEADYNTSTVTLTLTSDPFDDCSSDSDFLILHLDPGPSLSIGPGADLCESNSNVSLQGSFSNADGVLWSGGNGTFIPNKQSPTGTYNPTQSEISSGSITLVLSTNNVTNTCPNISDSVTFTFQERPTVSLGTSPTTICASTSFIELSGEIENAGGGRWTGGNGTFTPSRDSLSVKYFPTNAEKNNGSLTLTLSSRLETNGCSPVSEDLTISFLSPSSVTVNSPTIQTCANTDTIPLSSTVTGSASIIWTGGSGTFSPSDTIANPEYLVHSNDTSSGSIILYVETIGNDGCSIIKDSVLIEFSSPPTAEVDVSNKLVCANNPSVDLSGTFSNSAGIRWVGRGGTFSPSNDSLNTNYIPSQAEINANFTFLTLTTTGNGFCEPATDVVNVVISPAPTAEAQGPYTVCKNNPTTQVNAITQNSTGFFWSSTEGDFNDSTLINPIFTATPNQVNLGLPVTLTFTATQDPICAEVSDNSVLTFTPSPTIDAGPPQTICANNSFIQLNGSFTGATQATWSGGTGTFSNVNNLGSTYSPTLTEINSGKITLYLSTSAGIGTCNHVTDSITITITPAPIVDAGPNQTVCENNAQVTLNGTVQNATGGIWSGGEKKTSSNVTTLTNAHYTPSKNEKDNGSVTIYLTSTGNGNCNPVTDSTIITITPEPKVTNFSNISVCADNPNVTYEPTLTIATGGIWSGGQGSYSPTNTSTNITYEPSISEINSGFVNLKFTTTGNGNCNAEEFNKTITISKAPIVSAGSNQTICGDENSVQLNGTVSNVTGGRWTTLGNGTFNNQNNLNARYTPSSQDKLNGIVKLVLTTTGNGLCNALTDTMQISFSEVPVANAGNNRTLCANEFPITLNAAGSIGSWIGGLGTFLPNRTTLNASYTPSASELNAGSVTITYQTDVSGVCPQVSDDVKFNLKEGPIVDAGPGLIICGNLEPFALTATIENANNGFWTTDGTGAFTPNAGNTSLTYIPSPSDTSLTDTTQIHFFVGSVGNLGCPSSEDSITVTLIPAPVLIAGPDQTLCADGKDIILNGTSMNITTVSWSGGNGGNFNPINNITTTYTPNNTDLDQNSIELVVSSPASNVCPLERDTTIITFVKGPTTDAGPNTTICADSNFLLIQASLTGANTGVWTTSGTGTFSPTATDTITRYYPSLADTALGEIILHFKTNGSGICEDVKDSLILSISNAPRVISGNDTTICSDNGPIQLNGKSNGVSSSFLWTSSGTGTFSDPTDLQSTYTLSPDDITNTLVTLRLQTTGSGDCNEVAHSFNISLTPTPSISAGLNQTVCIVSPSVSVSSVLSESTGVSWASLTNGTFDDSLALNTVYSFSSQDTTNGFATLTATSTGNGLCKAYTDTTIIQFQDLPEVNAGEDVEICGDDVSVPVSGTVSGAAGGNWTSTGTGIFTPNFASLNTNYQVTNNDTANGSVSLVLTSTGSGVCPDISDTLIVTITDVPRVFAGNDTSVCANVDSIPLNGKLEIAKGGMWLSSGTGGFSPNDTTLNAFYIPSSSDTAAGNVTITLVSTGNGNCNRVLNDFILSFTRAPQANAGPNTSICADSIGVMLNPTITSYSSLVWRTSGTGVFGPDSTFKQPTYYPSASDTSNKTVTLTAFVKGLGTCNAITASTVLNIVPEHQVSLINDFTVCEGTRLFPISASFNNTTGGMWSSNSSGSFTPSAFDAATNFAPSNSNTDSEITLVFTTDDGGICPQKSDSLKVIVTPKPIVNAGGDLILCADAEFFRIRGSVLNATGGSWSTSGSGAFLPDENSLIIDYALSETDVLEDSLVFSLSATDTNNCATITDELIVNLTPIPTISAGSDINVCPGVASIPLSGNVTVSAGGIWETPDGLGVFSDSSQLSTTYIPDPTESIEGNSITITLNSTGNGDCRTYFEDIIISFTNTSFINAIPNDTIVCNTDFPIQLGSEGAQGEWSTLGSGTFLPNNRTPEALYLPSSTDSSTGSVKIYLTSINNGSCPALLDSMTIGFIDGPVVNAGPDLIICTNENTVALQGSSFNTGSVVWSSNGKGSFDDVTSTTPTYTLSTQDKSLGSINFTLTSLDNGQCSQPSDRMKVSVLPGPTVDPGNGFTICADNSQIQLNGRFTNATGATWSGGSNSFTPSNTNMGALYQIQPADTSAGFVTLTLTSQGHPNCNSSIDNVTFTFKKFPIATAGDDQTICANVKSINLNGKTQNAANRRWSVKNGSGQFSPSNQLDSTSYFLSSADTSKGSLTFYYIATPTNLCPQVRDSVVLTINPSPVVNAGLNVNECETVPTIDLNGSSKNTSSILWISSGSGTFNPNNTTLNSQYLPDSIDLVKGAVNLELRSTEPSCNPVSDFSTINFIRFPEAIVNAGVDISVCSDASEIQLQGTIRSARSGKWSTSGNGQFTPNDSVLNAKYLPVPSDTLAGTIYIRLTAIGNSECGEVTDSIALTFTDAPKADLGGNIIVCEDTSFVPLRAQLTVSSGVQWSTSGSGIFSPSKFDTVASYIPSPQDKAAGLIVISALTTGNGTCHAITESITLKMTPTPSIEAGISQLVCETTQDVFVKGTIKVATQGIWSTSGNGAFNNPSLKSTVYHPSNTDIENEKVVLQFTTTNHGQCKPVSDPLIISFEKAPKVFIGANQTICEDFNSINLNANVENESSIRWSTLGSGSFSTIDGEETTYSLSNEDQKSSSIDLLLTATGNSNCNPAMDTITIFIVPAPVADAVASDLCKLEDGALLTGTVTHANGGVWSTDGTGSFSPNITSLNGSYFPSFVDSKIGSVDLTLTTTGNGLCQPVSSETFIEILPLPTANAGQDQTVCVGAEVTLSATVEPNITYEWRTLSGILIASTPTTTLTVNTNTTFVLNAIREDGCSSSDQVAINVFELPTLELDTHFCFNDTLLITATALNMPLVPGNFQWFRNGVILQGERSTSYIIPSPGSYSIAFSYAGCTTDTATYVTPLPELLSFNEIGCRYDSTIISTSTITNANYIWTNETNIVSTANPATVATPIDSSVFTVAVSNILGCTSYDSLKVFGVEKPEIIIDDSTACNGDLLTLNAEPLNIDSLFAYRLVYVWKRNEQLLADTINTISINTSGTYSAAITIGQCMGIDSSIILINESPIIDLPELLEICAIKRELQEVDAGSAKSYLWSNGDTTQSIVISDTGLFTVIVTNEFDCSATDSMRIVESCPPEIFVPKAFVPGYSNPDALFEIFGHDFINFKMTIYNRWGEVIYFTDNPENPWDGEYLGKLMPVGVYPWVIDFQDLNGVQQPTLEGSVTIVR